MGPSGSGKSSLLNVLAGRSASASGISVTGNVFVGGKKIDPVLFREHIAYAMQDDSLMATATPREALMFSARLRLPPSTTKEEMEAIVERLLVDLGLESCADVMIGGPLIKGISGGQRKRTSVGVELVTGPALIFLDEPTSGLDSYSAYCMIQLLKKLAAESTAVLCTIHQPSSEVFELFDTAIFMKDGMIFYHGPVPDITRYFSSFDYHCPANYNPSDYVMFLTQTVSSEVISSKGMFLSSASQPKVVPATDDKSTGAAATEFSPKIQSAFLKQLYYLSTRELQNVVRDKQALGTRFGTSIFLSLLFGLIFLNAGGKDDSDPDNFNSHFGAVTLVLISAMMGATQPVMLAFPFERPMFMREYATGTCKCPYIRLMHSIIYTLSILSTFHWRHIDTTDTILIHTVLMTD
jgi:ABC-type multidrug transport system ATPase subunit